MVGSLLLKRTSLIHSIYLRHFSQPAWQRGVYRAMTRLRARRIVEIGVGDCARSRCLLRMACRYHQPEKVCYTGIDLFEARPVEVPGLTLKRAHQVLKPYGCRVQFIPADPYTALIRVANDLIDSDVIIVSADQDSNSLHRAWYYVPRMLHARTHVVVEKTVANSEEMVFQNITALDVSILAEIAMSDERRAA